MSIKNVLTKWIGNSPACKAESVMEFELERLENRVLMAADISLHGGTLKIHGSNDGERVDVDGTGAGRVAVYVNGSFRNAYSGVHSIKANLKGGADQLYLSAIDISKNVNIKMGDGADVFDIDTRGHYSTVEGDSRIDGNVKVHMGGDSGDFTTFDLVDNSFGVAIGGSLSVVGVADLELDGFGFRPTPAEAGDINIGRHLSVKMTSFGNVGGGPWTIYLDDVNVSGKTNIRGGHGVDTMRVIDSHFSGKTSFKLQGGNDALQVADSVFQQSVVFHGGHGTNTLATAGNTC